MSVSKSSRFDSSAILDGDSQSISATLRQHKLVDEFRKQVQKGGNISWDLGTLEGIVDALRHPDGVDDRKMLLEHILVYLSQRADSKLSSTLQNKVVELLYLDLPHPPETYVGNQYAWRTADGCNNNIAVPEMGKAGTPYARSVQQTHALPRNELPDAGLVFDTLLRREDFVKHPAGLSSMMFSFAALVIHTVFRTSHTNVSINETSSYVDLSPLYGHDAAALEKIRVRNGRGLLKPDTFAEDRLLLLPPAVCVLLVLFNRNHNYIAKMLLQINERGTYVDPNSIPHDDPKRSAKLLAQEEEIFQVARLINCAWFASAVFSDYFSAILGLVRQGNSWSLNPFGEIRQADHSLFERGQGNVCSVEFNCLYRWHATTSQADEKWVEQLFAQMFKDKTWDQVSIADFKAAAKQAQAMEPDVTHWTFGNLQRQDDGTFKDEDLAGVIYAATEHPAGAFGARRTPHVMRLHEIMGIESNRQWGVCSLNDFRKFLGLKTYDSFLEWNPDPAIAAAAEKLYGHIDRLELYVGLQAEASKPVIEGAGLCPSYTISRAILSDAIALTRGDRFFTADYTPFNMTSWGFADCQRDPTGPGYGSTLGRLFLRTLPGQFAGDSSYTWFPLMTPDAMTAILKNVGDIKKYNLTRPLPSPSTFELNDYKDVAHVLWTEGQFNVRYASRAGLVINGEGFFIASEDPERAGREHHALVKALTAAAGSEQKIAAWFYQKTRELIMRESYTTVGSQTKYVDIVRDVLRLLPIHWAAELAGIQIKSSASSDGDYTSQELFDMISDIYSFLFLDVEASKLMNFEAQVKNHVQDLLQIIRRNFGGSRLSVIGMLESIAQWFSGTQSSTRYEFAERLSAFSRDADAVCNMVLALLVGSTVEMSQALVHVVNFYLDSAKPRDVNVLASKSEPDADDEALMEGFVLEALRLDPTFRGVYRESMKPVAVGQHKFQANQRVFVNIHEASLDSHVFAHPRSVNPKRTPMRRYLFGDGSAKCIGPELSTKIQAHVVRAIFSLPHLQRGPGQSGILKRFKVNALQTSTYAYLSPTQQLSPWADSMVVKFD
ncbi:linoleate diol synthase [Obba rivulosa]|uniref:Linoleate diol synthase n=1 Tax=Obba rivulosa TaxID=1052685 RepID=A0A8E2J866_9APHY|nr:linoleate diol synthase [Obba rivulosa]